MTHPDFRTEIKLYLEDIYQEEIHLEYIGPIDKKDKAKEDLKEFGYGKNILIEFTLHEERKSFILSTMNKNTFGHYFFYDRARSLMLAHSCYNNLPHHVRSIDVGAFTGERKFKSAGNCKEFFILREKVEGTLYYLDLEKIENTESLTVLDMNRCIALANYLAQIHSEKSDEEVLYIRRLRELIGHGECIMGLTDSYPKDAEFITRTDLETIEKKCIEWRYKLKNKTHRLCQVHGDFHPWNILFREGEDFSVIDRSRGEWGEAADDVTALSINYLFYALQNNHDEKVRDNFLFLFNLFWETYLARSDDNEILSLVAPFYAWRGLVIASPLWYPDLEVEIRTKIFTFINDVLTQDTFELDSVGVLFE